MKPPEQGTTDNRESPGTPDATPLAKQAFPVVGIGASAGGLEALESFFDHLPAAPGLALVIIQHLSPKHKSIMGQILQRHTSLPVRDVEDGLEVAPDTVYFNSPDREVAIFNGKFQLTEPRTDQMVRLPIDYFFRSLADDLGERAICIVLSGTGSDGTLGLQAVKGAGGLTLAQEERQAKYPFMPRSAILTGSVDHILPVEEMPAELVRYLQHPYLGAPPRTVSATRQFESFVDKILLLIRTTTRHDFTGYKPNTIRRRIERRMALHKLNRIADYYRYLQENHEEVRFLFQDLLITVTSFFRDPEAFKILSDKVIEEIVARKETGDAVRVWVPGCASGEEAISLAILLTEARERQGKAVAIQVFATDIDAAAINRARQAEYPESIAADVSPERLKNFFIKKDNAYKLRPEIRETLVFATQNLITDPPFSKLDLISCRNVLIYLGVELQKKLIPLFHFVLNQGGHLFLGSSESIGVFADLFRPLDSKWKIYQRKDLGLDPRAELPSLFTPEGHLTPPRSDRRPGQGVATLREVLGKVILDRFAPPCVLINENYDILHFQGATDRFLAPPIGDPSLNLLKMAREGLRHRLAPLLRQAIKERLAVHAKGLILPVSEGHRIVDLTVQPLDAALGSNLFLVVFEDKTPAAQPPKKSRKPAPPEEADTRLRALEEELQASNETLQATIEELEASNEELKSANEEMQSANEELQSSNEELETSKEELQSTNEELMTVNTELQHKMEELTAINNDIDNLLAGTEIGTIFLDHDLVIKRFTPSMTTLFNLIPTDIDRSLTDITSRFNYDHLTQDAQEVLTTLQSKEMEMETRSGAWFNMRILPYRTREHVIEGVVITFTDITRLKHLGDRLQEALDYAQGIVETVREPIMVLTEDLRVRSANSSFYRTFKTTPSETEGRRIYELGNGQWDLPRLRQLLEEIVPRNTVFENFAVEQDFPGLGPRAMVLNARRLPARPGKPGLILLAMEDVTGGATGCTGGGDAQQG
jgi:two-component system, chemotaxis family, CheB/CheR fusion protein